MFIIQSAEPIRTQLLFLDFLQFRKVCLVDYTNLIIHIDTNISSIQRVC